MSRILSIPGIERPLKKPQDFQRFAGQLAKIKTLSGIDPDESGRKRKVFIGLLRGFEGQDILLTLKEKSAAEIRIPLDQVDRAHLEFEF